MLDVNSMIGIIFGDGTKQFFFFGSDMFREVHAVHGLKRKYVGRYRVIVELQGDCRVTG